MAEPLQARARLIPSLAVLAGMAALALIAPLVANNRPIAVWGAGRLVFPVAGADSGPIRDGVALWPLVRYSYYDVKLQEALQAPSRRHPFGTDALGRDLLARVLHGARVSLLVGFGAALLALTLGALLGGTAGLRGGLPDLLLTRVIEILACFPPFILALALVTVSGGSGLVPIISAIGLSRASSAARFMRGEIQRWRGAGLWLAARASGASLPRLALRHILPLAAGPLAVQAAFGVAQAILLESSLSFLGLGVQPPTPSWGMILAEGRLTVEVAWWPVVLPAGALALTLALLGWAGDRAHGGA